MKEKILLIGAGGQLGTELSVYLKNEIGLDQLVLSDVREIPTHEFTFEQLDVLDKKKLGEIVERHKITQIYHLAAVLSATAEKNPLQAWEINMNGLLNVLQLAVEKKISKVYWPSSIAVFGNSTPKDHTPQHTSMEPNTIYGISKLAGEGWCQYYNKKYDLDVRSLRYPGLIGYKGKPGGGTTDYAVEIYIQAKKNQNYSCFLSENTYLPMMYMDDALKATWQLMNAPSEDISIRTSYNINGLSFSPKEITQSIQKVIPSFTIDYHPDFRQKIADTWPNSIDDSIAARDWDWMPQFDLDQMTRIMLQNV